MLRQLPHCCPPGPRILKSDRVASCHPQSIQRMRSGRARVGTAPSPGTGRTAPEAAADKPIQWRRRTIPSRQRRSSARRRTHGLSVRNSSRSHRRRAPETPHQGFHRQVATGPNSLGRPENNRGNREVKPKKHRRGRDYESAEKPREKSPQQTLFPRPRPAVWGSCVESPGIVFTRADSCTRAAIRSDRSRDASRR